MLAVPPSMMDPKSTIPYVKLDTTQITIINKQITKNKERTQVRIIRKEKERTAEKSYKKCKKKKKY